MNSANYPVVNSHISGSHVVVHLGHDEYIDARKDYRTPGHSHVEYVRNGQVRNRVVVNNEKAPEYIVGLMREII